MTTEFGQRKELDLAPIEARCEAASEGPWAWEHVGEGSWCLGVVDPPMTGEIVEKYDEATGTYAEKPVVIDWVCEGSRDADDARFIAHARTDVPNLVAEVRRLRAAAVERFALLKRVHHALACASDMSKDVEGEACCPGCGAEDYTSGTTPYEPAKIFKCVEDCPFSAVLREVDGVLGSAAGAP